MRIRNLHEHLHDELCHGKRSYTSLPRVKGYTISDGVVHVTCRKILPVKIF